MKRDSKKGVVAIILIPAFQPQEPLIVSTNRLVADGYTVVVVDDGSGKQYRNIFDQLHKNIHFVRHEVNKGKGAALKTGFRYIQETFHDFVIVTADADGQHNVDDVKKVADSYPAYAHTLLLGARAFESHDVPLRSKIGNIFTRKVFALITRQQLTDTQTGLRAFDESLTSFMIDISGERFEYEINVLLACSREDVPIVELPIQTIYENGNETSHFNPINDSLAIYGQIIKFASSSLLSFGLDYILFLFLLSFVGGGSSAGGVIFANIFARLVSASFNFTINRRLVFQHKDNVAKNALSYFLLAASILIGNTLLLTLLTSVFGIAPFVAKIMTEVVLFVASYYVQKNIIFNRKQSEAHKV